MKFNGHDLLNDFFLQSQNLIGNLLTDILIHIIWLKYLLTPHQR